MLFLMKVAVEGQTPHIFRFPHAEVNVGRSSENHLLLAHASVDERHARLLTRDGRFIVVDLKSTTGTFLNGRRINAPCIVRERDVIRVGAYEIGVLERELPTDTERAFLDALDKNPHDDEMRIVYCDWLEEHNRPDDAEFLRAQLALKEMAPEHPRFHELTSVIETLAPRMTLAWRRTVARPPIEKCPVRFELVCPKRWDALAPTASPTERYCDGCKKNVHYAPNVLEARRLALGGHCVAVDVGQPRYKDDLETPSYPRLAGMIAPPPSRPPGIGPSTR